MSLNKHQIFAADDLAEKYVDMPEWGGDVKIKALSVAEQLDYDAFLAKAPSEMDMAIKLILLGCIDDKNNKLFNEDDADLLKNKKSDSIFKLVSEIIKLNQQRPQDVDNLAKN